MILLLTVFVTRSIRLPCPAGSLFRTRHFAARPPNVNAVPVRLDGRAPLPFCPSAVRSAFPNPLLLSVPCATMGRLRPTGR